MIRGFLSAVPPLRHGARASSTAARVTDAPVTSTAWSTASEATVITYPDMNTLQSLNSGWGQDPNERYPVKDTPFAAQPAVFALHAEHLREKNWAAPSIAALHADLARVRSIRAEAEPSAEPTAAFAPVKMAALHADFANIQSAEETFIAAEERSNVWAVPSVFALHADLALVQGLHAEAEPAAQPTAAFAPLKMAALHADFAKIQAAEEDHIAAEQRGNVWAVPSVFALHADLAHVQGLIAAAEPEPAVSAFAPPNMAALHADFANIQSAEKDHTAPTNPFAPHAVYALHADFDAVEAIRAADVSAIVDVVPELAGQTQFVAFAPVSVSRMHEDFAKQTRMALL